VLADWHSAPLDEATRAALGLIETVTLAPDRLSAADFESVRRAGLSEEAIEEALQVCALFNIYTRVADALGFDIPSPEAFSKTADVLLSRGYE